MTGGGPAKATESVVYWIWEVGFILFQMGRAAAGTTILFLIILVIALVQRRFLGWSEDLY
jgi:multiple sugar transport system permease protein